ncbi:MAG: gas vesicle protein GvpH [Tepidisphaeraceae bacterium]|jgi:HSP20 family protein
MRKKESKTSVEGILGGLSTLIGGLAELAEKGKELRQSGETSALGGKAKIIYGFTVKGMGGDDLRVEPFGNVVRDGKTSEATVSEVREPAIDLIEESDHTLVVAEMPGVGANDVKVEAHGDVLDLTAAHAGKKYRKEILLSHATDAKKVTVTINNGIAEIRCPK